MDECCEGHRSADTEGMKGGAGVPLSPVMSVLRRNQLPRVQCGQGDCEDWVRFAGIQLQVWAFDVT